MITINSYYCWSACRIILGYTHVTLLSTLSACHYIRVICNAEIKKCMAFMKLEQPKSFTFNILHVQLRYAHLNIDWKRNSFLHFLIT
jgi:hypothetical protein